MFNEGRENVHDEAQSGRPSLVNYNLVCKVTERVRDDRRFTISDLSLHFPHISRTVLYDIVSSHLGYRRPRSMRRVYKNSLKNVESDNNNVLYETLLDFFYSETVLTFWISLLLTNFKRAISFTVHVIIFFQQKHITAGHQSFNECSHKLRLRWWSAACFTLRSLHSTPRNRHFTKPQDIRLNWVQEPVGIWWREK